MTLTVVKVSHDYVRAQRTLLASEAAGQSPDAFCD